MSFQFLWNEKEAVGNWVVSQFNGYFKSIEEFVPFEAVGICLDGKPIAAAIFHQFHELEHGNAMDIVFCAISPRWATRENIRRVLDYPFNQSNCVRVTTRIAANNRRSRRFNEGLGFRREGEIRRGFDGKTNLCIYGLLREEAQRWLVPDLGKKAA